MNKNTSIFETKLKGKKVGFTQCLYKVSSLGFKYVTVPLFLARKQSILSFQTKDNFRFVFGILASLHQGRDHA